MINDHGHGDQYRTAVRKMATRVRRTRHVLRAAQKGTHTKRLNHEVLWSAHPNKTCTSRNGTNGPTAGKRQRRPGRGQPVVSEADRQKFAQAHFGVGTSAGWQQVSNGHTVRNRHEKAQVRTSSPYGRPGLTYRGVTVVDSAGTVVHIPTLNPIFVTAVIVNTKKIHHIWWTYSYYNNEHKTRRNTYDIKYKTKY